MGSAVFDTTDPEVAKKSGLDKNVKPVIICLGKNVILPGLEAALVGKEIGKDYSIELEPENAFGKKDTKKIELIPTAKFKKEGMQPQPGMQVNIDGQLAVIKRVSGGRTLVDFNHPLAGITVTYDIKIVREVSEPGEKLSAFIPGETKFENGVATVPEFPEESKTRSRKTNKGKHLRSN